MAERLCGQVLERGNPQGGRARCPQPAYATADGCWYHAISQPHAAKVASDIEHQRTFRANPAPPIRLRADGKGRRREGQYS